MEEKFIPYNQICDSYGSEGAQSAPVPAAAQPDQPTPQPTPSQPETQSTRAGTSGQDAAILSLTQMLSNALHYQQVLEEKLSSMVDWQERQEKVNQNLAAQQQALLARVEALSSQISASSAQPHSAPATSAALDDILKALSRVEKSSLDAIRESKNFQQTLYAKQNKELDSYRALHANMANANTLTEIANFRNAAEDIARHLDDVQAKNLRIGVVEAIDEYLEDNGVTIRQTPVGQRRSLRTCQTRKQVPTGDESLHGTVAYSASPSFAIGNLLLMKEIVDTYIYDPSLNQPAEPEEPDTSTAASDEAPPAPQAAPEDIPTESAAEVPAEEAAPADQPQNAAPAAEATPDQNTTTV